MVGFLHCKCTLSAHVQLYIHQYPQDLLSKAALHPFLLQLVLIPGAAPAHVQGLTRGLVEPHEIHVGQLLNLVKVLLDGIPSLRHVNRTTQLGVFCKLAEGALDLAFSIIDEYIKLVPIWSKYFTSDLKNYLRKLC